MPTPTRSAAGAIVLAIILLAGCATLPEGEQLPEIGEWERRTAILAAVDEFEFTGRIGVKAGDDGFNGKFHWRQDRAHYDARVSGPLGIGTILLEGKGRQVEITDKDGIRTELDDVEPELYLRYGWTIPVESLRYWALGIPDPAIPASTEFGDDGQLRRLEQRGWSVEITRYSAVDGGQLMPSRLTAMNPDTSVRLVIDDWVFHEQFQD